MTELHALICIGGLVAIYGCMELINYFYKPKSRYKHIKIVPRRGMFG